MRMCLSLLRMLLQNFRSVWPCMFIQELGTVAIRYLALNLNAVILFRDYRSMRSIVVSVIERLF